ncbi:hypothetical protein RDWZM_000535 [Blomia tropicalis]|uniref:Uncharacterized protein n=1 Tax=Blomia tropicalis TaxID=40697 RepID=A0A9Q0MDY4_BLOTA|nr:hypothetical protein BLOT_012182 [Blomia tropicalis]KAJ6221990.1 hypothetical protein RDWZM_000535 [Blomia tropicalis]
MLTEQNDSMGIFASRCVTRKNVKKQATQHKMKCSNKLNVAKHATTLKTLPTIQQLKESCVKKQKSPKLSSILSQLQTLKTKSSTGSALGKSRQTKCSSLGGTSTRPLIQLIRNNARRQHGVNNNELVKLIRRTYERILSEKKVSNNMIPVQNVSLIYDMSKEEDDLWSDKRMKCFSLSPKQIIKSQIKLSYEPKSRQSEHEAKQPKFVLCSIDLIKTIISEDKMLERK